MRTDSIRLSADFIVHRAFDYIHAPYGRTLRRSRQEGRRREERAGRPRGDPPDRPVPHPRKSVRTVSVQGRTGPLPDDPRPRRRFADEGRPSSSSRRPSGSTTATPASRRSRKQTESSTATCAPYGKYESETEEKPEVNCRNAQGRRHAHRPGSRPRAKQCFTTAAARSTTKRG
ncbi:MAG: hypothetical protein MZU97_13655 [Bacillus subtilis]|nr:hypothetical protein [Bacillus subtilis]